MSSLKWFKEMKKMEEEMNQKLSFLSGFKDAFRDQIHTDILIKPGDDSPSIPAHRALLVYIYDFATIYNTTIFKHSISLIICIYFCNAGNKIKHI